MTDFTLSLFGGFSLAADGKPVALPGRKDRLLLAYLALRPGTAHPREALYTLLWGERPEEQARASLRQSLAALRDAFRPHGPDPIAAGREHVTLRAGAIACDVLQLEAAAADGPLTADVLASAGTELLAGLDAASPAFADWLAAERQRMDGLALRVLERCTTYGVDGVAAEALAQRLIRRDPLLEPAYCALMRLLVSRGARAEALKTYAACRKALQQDLAIAPSLETEQLYRDIVTAAGQRTDESGSTAPARPGLAVLPFDAIGGNAAMLTLGEALAEEITGGLGRFRQFDVIDRNSSAAMAKLYGDTAEIGRRLGVGLLVRGSIMRMGERMRVTVTLVDAPQRRQMWSEVFDREAEDLLSLPDVIARAIVARLHARVEVSLLEQSRRKPALAAYECVLTGVKHLRMVGHEHNVEAVRCFDEALARDPGYALAHAYRAFADVVLHGYDGAPPEILASARKRGEDAVAMDPDCARCRWLLAMTYSYCGDMESDRREHEHALALNPYDANVLASYGNTLAMLGNPEEGVRLIRESMRLNPYHPEWYWIDLGNVLYVAKRYADAIEAFRHKRDPKVWVLARLAACHAQLGQHEEAAAAVREVFKQQPGFRLSQQRGGTWSPYDTAHFREGMLKAGLPP